MSEPTTTRLAGEYRLALFKLRQAITNGESAEALLDHVQDLADELMRGTGPLVEVPLSVAQAELEAERARENAPLGDFVRLDLPSDTDVSGLIKDNEPHLSGLRDNRQHPELARAG